MADAMVAQQRRAVWWLGLCQCGLWGALYYSLTVLLPPLAQASHQSRATVAAGFSLALLVAAMAAPAVGRRLDRGEAKSVFRLGIPAAAVGLVILASTSSWGMWIGWVIIGVASAMVLYEPAFALVIRAVADRPSRVNALATVTILGGLASMIGGPGTAAMVTAWGVREALVACAVSVLAFGLLLERAVLPVLRDQVGSQASPMAGGPRSVHLPPIAAVFALATMVSMALATLMIPALHQRGVPLTTAAWCLGAFGLAQLPGRIWLSGRTASLSLLHPGALVLQGAGVLLVAPDGVPFWVTAVGAVLFGLGAGLQTVIRPWMIETLVGSTAAGRSNAEVARLQGFARAAAPVGAIALADRIGIAPLLAAAGLLLIGCVPEAIRQTRP